MKIFPAGESHLADDFLNTVVGNLGNLGLDLALHHSGNVVSDEQRGHQGNNTNDDVTGFNSSELEQR